MTINETSLLFFALSLVSFFWKFRKPSWDALSPGRLYSTVWFGAIGITALGWSNLQVDWTWRSWLYILSSVAAFLLGNLMGRLHWRLPQKGLNDRVGEPLRQWASRFDRERTLWGLASITAVWIGAVVYRTQEIGALPAFAFNTESARFAFISPTGPLFEKIVTQLLFLVHPVMVLSLFWVVVFARKAPTHQKVFVAAIFGTAFLFPFAIVARGALIFPGLACMAFYNYAKRRIGSFEAMVFGAILLSAIVAIPIYRHLTSVGYGENYTYYIARMNIAKEYSNLSGPYVNIALSMDNLVQLFEVPHHWTYGLLTLRPLWTITGIKSLWLADVKLPFEWSIGFNTATYLFPFYYDFAYAGVVVFPFLFGAICAALYRGVCLFRPLPILAYSFIVSGICLSVMDNIFVYIPFWVDIVMISAVIKFAEAPKGRVQLEFVERAKLTCSPKTGPVKM